MSCDEGEGAPAAPPSVLYVRPHVDAEDLGLLYRDMCNRTGRCPGCDVDVEHSLDRSAGLMHVLYRHDDTCPVLTSTAQPDYNAPSRLEARRVGRNERCPCASGRKWKHCCGRVA